MSSQIPAYTESTAPAYEPEGPSLYLNVDGKWYPRPGYAAYHAAQHAERAANPTRGDLARRTAEAVPGFSFEGWNSLTLAHGSIEHAATTRPIASGTRAGEAGFVRLAWDGERWTAGEFTPNETPEDREWKRRMAEQVAIANDPMFD